MKCKYFSLLLLLNLIAFQLFSQVGLMDSATLFKHKQYFFDKAMKAGNRDTIYRIWFFEPYETKLPEELFSFHNLQELTIGADIEHLPANFSTLKNLQYLYIFGSNLTNISRVGELRNLKSFRFASNNGLDSLSPSIGDLSNLVELDIHRCVLKYVPPEIGKLNNLKYLALVDCNSLTNLPDEIGNLISLRYVDLSYSGLKSLPEEIGKLTNLEQLLLTSNEIKSLPAGIGGLINLKTLDVYANEMSNLPDEIGQLMNLEKLTLGGSLYRNNRPSWEINPAIYKLKKLKKLILWDCNLNKLPQGISNLDQLEYLNLSNNRFTIFPEDVLNLANLDSLYLGSNGINVLPDQIAKLQSLKVLSLNGNNLSKLPASVGEMQNLEELDVADSYSINELPEEMAGMKAFAQLNIQRIDHVMIPASLAILANLKCIHYYKTNKDVEAWYESLRPIFKDKLCKHEYIIH